MSTKNWKKHPKKLLTYGGWEFFSSAARDAPNSPELHFCFINSFIQPSLLGSLQRCNCSHTANTTSTSNKAWKRNATKKFWLLLFCTDCLGTRLTCISINYSKKWQNNLKNVEPLHSSESECTYLINIKNHYQTIFWSNLSYSKLIVKP